MKRNTLVTLQSALSHQQEGRFEEAEKLCRAALDTENPGDVIVSLEDGCCSGLKTFMDFVKIVSTHGSLNRRNSTTFIMSTAWALPPLMRSADIPRCLGEKIGRPWPMGK